MQEWTMLHPNEDPHALNSIPLFMTIECYSTLQIIHYVTYPKSYCHLNDFYYTALIYNVGTNINFGIFKYMDFIAVLGFTKIT